MSQDTQNLIDSFPDLKNYRKMEQLNNDFVIFNDLKSMPLYDSPSRIDTTIISVCLRGFTRLEINMQEYLVNPGTMIVALPDQIMQNLEISDNFLGLFIAVSREYTDEIFPKMKIILPFYLYTREYPCISLKENDIQMLMEYYDLFWKKVEAEENTYRKDIIQGLLMAMFYEIYNLYRSFNPRKIQKKSRKEMLFDQFMRTLSKNYKKERSVNFYAKELFLTPKHLSSVVKEMSGKTAGEWIDYFVIFEAKSLLKSSQMNIQEISDELNFANQSFFGKFFKQHTGMSPKEYRRK